MSEKWAKWEPVSGLAEKYDIDSIIDDIESFRMLLATGDESKKKVRVIFEESVDAYRRSDEALRVDLIGDLRQQYGGNFYGKWTFFKVENSTYLRWISEQSCTIADSLPYMHFAFIAGNFVVDVIAFYEPKVEFLDG